VISIFVNPLQFGVGEDYMRYPRPFEADLKLAEKEGMDVVFAPADKEMYPGVSEIVVEAGRLGDVLCGASRPGHFRGVLTVVAKLFHILQPDRAFFGQKDAQQAILIQRMVAELNFPVAVDVGPTVREPDGLALSSRNAYLSAAERAQAPVLFRALRRAETLLASGERQASRLEQEMQVMIQSAPGAVLDYARVVDCWTLEPLTMVEREALAAVAVRFGGTRLIDNLVLGQSEEDAACFEP
jgi:pantoate--beta-alanine ligase